MVCCGSRQIASELTRNIWTLIDWLIWIWVLTFSSPYFSTTTTTMTYILNKHLQRPFMLCSFILLHRQGNSFRGNYFFPFIKRHIVYICGTFFLLFSSSHYRNLCTSKSFRWQFFCWNSSEWDNKNQSSMQ